jgi:hypothetical protein
MDHRLVETIEELLRSALQQLSDAESGQCKFYCIGPGGASIDGMPKYIETLREQVAKFERVLEIARQSTALSGERDG